MAGITDRAIVKGVKPDIAESAFVAFLRAQRSPATSAGSAVYRACVARGVSPAFILGLFGEESTWGTNRDAIAVGGGGAARATFSWGNTTEPSYGDPGMGPPYVRGRFTVYADWEQGGVSTVVRLVEHPPYHGKATIRELIETWAPDSENRTADYIAGVVATMNRLGATPQQGTGGATVALSKPAVNTKHPSPNRGYATGVHRVDAVIWHVTAGGFAGSLGWLTNPSSGASSNYLINKDGAIYELVPPGESAWANGAVAKPDTSNPLIRKWLVEKANFNQRTVSIEVVRESSANERPGGFTDAQHRALVNLTAWLCQEYRLTPDRVHIFGHRSIDSVNRPHCPGLAESEWDAWVAEVAAMLAGSQPLPTDTGFPGVIQPDGRSVVNGVDFGGTANVAEAVEITVKNAQGEHFSRKWEGHALGEWRKVG